MIDSVPRRKIFGRPLHPHTDFPLLERDLLIMEMIHVHGPCSTLTLFRLTNHLKNASNFDPLKRRLRKLFDHGYISRPKEQGTREPNTKLLVYDITDKGITTLKEWGRDHDLIPATSTDHWVHDYGLSAITTSLQIGTIGTNVQYLYHHEVMELMGIKTLSLKIPDEYYDRLRKDLKLSHEDIKALKRDLIPDRLAGLRYPDGTVRILFIEFHRTKQGNKLSTLDRKSQLRMLYMYSMLIGYGAYRTWCKNGERAVCLNVFSSNGQMKNVMDLLTTLSSGGSNFMLYKSWNEFSSKQFHTPDPRPDLFTEPWHRAGKPPLSLTMV